MWWTILAVVTVVMTWGTALRITWGNRKIGALRDQDPAGIERWPAVSVIVAARNEQLNLRPALLSLMDLDYDDYEVVVVNDRSTDGTGELLAELAREHSRLTVLTVHELPAGWLGKNHALWQGAERARGEYLLFTDADVVMERSTLRRAMAYVQREQVDHLAGSPGVIMSSLMLQAFVVLFVNLFALYTRAWKVADSRSSAFIGIGAFNLVRAEVYRAVGTHQVIAMRPDDDVKLGKIIKRGGYRQRILMAIELVRVPWYGSVRELISGMEKNAFSGVDYRVSLVLAATVALLLFDIWPFLAVWILTGPARYLYAAVVVVLLGRSLKTAHEMRMSLWSAWLFPVAVALMIYIQWRAMLLTYIHGGIRWRGTHYPLSELKANKV